MLLDSPLISGWKATAVRVAKGTRLVGTVPPGAISRKRKNQWPGKEEAAAHFSGKKVFSLWEQQVLQDYIEHGTHDAQDDDGSSVRRLSFDRQVETDIYNTLPHNLERILKRHPLQCPVEFIGGHQSAELKQAGMALTKKVTKGRITLMQGSHLFPMEAPAETAAAIEAALTHITNLKRAA